MKTLKQKNGFTLAEVLVTLAVAGVIAVLLIPVLDSQTVKSNIILAKKAYKITEEVVAKLANDRLLYATDGDDVDLSNQAPGQRTETVIQGANNPNLPIYEGESKFRNAFRDSLNIDERDRNVDEREDVLANYQFITTDGIAWNIQNTDEGFDIEVDVNGEKAPNCSEADNNCEKPDRLTFNVEFDGRVLIRDDMRARQYVYGTSITNDD